MKTSNIAPDYKGYRFPSEIISHAVWLYFRFSLSFRDVEERFCQNSGHSGKSELFSSIVALTIF